MSDKKYYSIVTKKFNLKTSHEEWLIESQNIYNEVLYFYYCLFLDHSEIHGESGQNALRLMEQMTIVGRDKKPVSDPLPWKGIPLYFRRAAINAAIAAAKSFLARDIQEEPTSTFSSGVTLYKGMYRELTSQSVQIKVYDGEEWRWICCRLYGNILPDNVLCMSPRLVFREKRIELHVPVKYPVQDGRTLKERVQSDLKICTVQFTGGNAIAVCCILDTYANVEKVLFIPGGREYRHRCRMIWKKIEASRKARGNVKEDHADWKYRQKWKHINEDLAHQVSSRIVEFCRENKGKIILLPKYSRDYSHIIMGAVESGSPIRVSYQIRRQLWYKAWKDGILVVETEVYGIGSKCAVCGEDIRKHGELYKCVQGHQGNRWVISSKNLGKNFLYKIGKQMR